jgi:predicted phosphodiesterase
MLHQLPTEQATVRDWAQATPHRGKPAERCREFLLSLPGNCRVVIFGHSHEPCALVVAGKLFFNPGSAGKKRFSLPQCCGMLEVLPEGVRATFLGLGRYNEGLPGEVWLPVGGL